MRTYKPRTKKRSLPVTIVHAGVNITPTLSLSEKCAAAGLDSAGPGAFSHLILEQIQRFENCYLLVLLTK